MRKAVLFFICILVFLSILWELVSASSHSIYLFASKPSEIVTVWQLEISSPNYWNNVKSTLNVLISGYVISLFIGYLLGATFYYLRKKGIDIHIFLLVLGSIPVFAIAPLIILAFGIGFSSRVTVVVLSSAFLIASGVYQAIKFADEEHGSIMRDLKTSNTQLWLDVLLPGGIIYSIPTLTGAIALSLIGVFIAEWISSQSGLGKYMLSAMSLYDSPRLMVGILTFMLISGIFMGIISYVEQVTLQWRQSR